MHVVYSRSTLPDILNICASSRYTLHDSTVACGAPGGCYLYGRSFNPTVRYLGRQLAAIEGTEAGYGTSSGVAPHKARLRFLLLGRAVLMCPLIAILLGMFETYSGILASGLIPYMYEMQE